MLACGNNNTLAGNNVYFSYFLYKASVLKILLNLA